MCSCVCLFLECVNVCVYVYMCVCLCVSVCLYSMYPRPECSDPVPLSLKGAMGMITGKTCLCTCAKTCIQNIKTCVRNANTHTHTHVHTHRLFSWIFLESVNYRQYLLSSGSFFRATGAACSCLWIIKGFSLLKRENKSKTLFSSLLPHIFQGSDLGTNGTVVSENPIREEFPLSTVVACNKYNNELMKITWEWWSNKTANWKQE